MWSDEPCGQLLLKQYGRTTPIKPPLNRVGAVIQEVAFYQLKHDVDVTSFFSLFGRFDNLATVVAERRAYLKIKLIFLFKTSCAFSDVTQMTLF